MRRGSLSRVATIATTAAIAASSLGCPSGDGGRGDACDGDGDCRSALQCLAGACTPLCQRAPECGDGYTCSDDGHCRVSTLQQGDTCSSETGCAPGLSCQLDGEGTDDNGVLIASCTSPNVGRPTGSTCTDDLECHNGTCALGHCVDLCDSSRDCVAGDACTAIPRVADEAFVGMFAGCLPAHGNLEYPLALDGATSTVRIPVPASATSVSIVMAVDDPAQLVGATRVTAPSGAVLLSSCGDDPSCDPDEQLYRVSKVRHRPELGQSVLMIPTSPATLLETGAYDVVISSLRPVEDGPPVAGSAVPRATVIYKLDSGLILDVHFHFLDLTDHPCASMLGGPMFGATIAQSSASFQDDFLGGLRSIFAHGGVTIGTVTYDDITGHPELDGLDAADAPSLLALGSHEGGIDVFFTRSISPVGILALGPNPGPAGIPFTRQSGVAIGLDSLCYRTWDQVSRTAAHEIARYMGLPHNVELETDANSVHFTDNIDDTLDDQPSTNLMFYSEFGGVDLTPGQSAILQRSPILR